MIKFQTTNSFAIGESAFSGKSQIRLKTQDKSVLFKRYVYTLRLSKAIKANKASKASPDSLVALIDLYSPIILIAFNSLESRIGVQRGLLNYTS